MTPQTGAGLSHGEVGSPASPRRRRPRDIGTAAETAVVRYLREHGFPHAERRSLRGALDAGDVTGIPSLCFQVKGGIRAENAGDMQVATWLAETERQRVNANADVGVLVLKRRGIGTSRVGQWWAVFDLQEVAAVLDKDPDLFASTPVRFLLCDAVHMLRTVGYGDPS